MSRAPTLRFLVVAVVASLAVMAAGCSSDDSANDSPASTAAVSDAASNETTTSTAAVALTHDTEIYDDPAVWTCRGDLDTDVCRDLDVSVVAADGTHTVEPRAAAVDAPIDCFYIYGTSSLEEGTNSDLVLEDGDIEFEKARAQMGQYSQACRVFAPVYRQATTGAIARGEYSAAMPLAYGDVVDSFLTYLSRWNDGRGFILVGHSQGSSHLIKLIEERIDDDASIHDRMVAAYLLGQSPQVPAGELVGGTFANVPVCTADSDTGCLVAFASFRAASPPPADAIFGAASGDTRAVCVNPVELLGRATASPVFPDPLPMLGGFGGTTGYAALPEMFTVSCERNETHDFLAVTPTAAANQAIVDQILREPLGATWGLHTLDTGIVHDDLVELAKRQADAYAKR